MKPSQAERLLMLLADGQPHSTPEILERVYGLGHSGIARIGARIADLKGRDYEIESWRDKDRPSVWWYRMKVDGVVQAAPAEAPARAKPRIEYVKIDGVMHARMVPRSSA